MKCRLLLIIMTFGALCSCDKKTPSEADTPTGQSEPTSGPIKLIFIPKNDIETTKINGQFKENTIYWTNASNNPNDGPRIVNTREGIALEIQGSQTNLPDKYASMIVAYRVFNVPANATYSTIDVVVKRDYNEWGDKDPKKVIATLGTSFLKAGKEAGGEKSEAPKNRPPASMKISGEIPRGAEQMVFKIVADNANTIQILDMNASFR